MTHGSLPDPVWLPETFTDATDRIEEAMQEPEMAAQVAVVRAEMNQEDAIRKIELEYHQAMTRIVGDPVYDQSPENEQVITHALAILPHLGPEATAAFLTSVHGQGLHRTLPT